MRQQHYRNHGEPGQTLFLTTTVLGFTPVFLDPRIADTMTAGLFQDVRHYGAILHAFVVMPEHIHVLLRLPENLGAQDFVHRIKTASANRCVPLTTESQRAQMRTDEDSSYRGFWKGRFRGYIVERGDEFDQKIDYIDLNPVRRGIVDRVGAYPWCSARFYPDQLASIRTGRQRYTEANGWDTGFLETHFPLAVPYDFKDREPTWGARRET